MVNTSKIEWTERVWNPTVGCSIVSPGCTNCYAMRMAWRLANNPLTPHYRGTAKLANGKAVWTGTINLAPQKVLAAPYKWRKPRLIFVNSMSDLFHADVPIPVLTGIWRTMRISHHERGHTFQILTKRPELIAMKLGPQGVGEYAIEGPVPRPAPGIWIGTSVENRNALARIDHLRNAPAIVKFLSIEPLLEDLGEIDLTGIDWVIVGGESGPGKRPVNLAWIRSIRDQCIAAGVKLFVKQIDKVQSVPEDLMIREYPVAA